MSEALKAERRSLVCGQGFGLDFVVATLNSELALLLGNLKMNKYSFFPTEKMFNLQHWTYRLLVT